MGGALVLTILLWQLPDLLHEPRLRVLVYPFRLFVTLVHEMGHGAAAALTGGSFQSLDVMWTGAGLAWTAGGMRFVIIQAGYLGAALFGAVLLMLANRLKDPRALTALLGVLCGGTPLLLARPGGWTTRLIGAAVLCVFLLLAAKGSKWLNAFVLNLLAMMVASNAVMDIWWLLGSLDATLDGIPNDARAMANLTHLPAQFWAIFWVLISIAAVASSVYWTFIRPIRTYNGAAEA